MKVAVIDIGTNTFHLLIANQNEVILKRQIPVKLAENMVGNKLADEAIDRAIEALNVFKELITTNKVGIIKAIATSGLRNAENKDQIITKAKALYNIDISIIEGITEAELIFKGVSIDWPVKEATALVMDIGGGSVEFMIGSQAHLLWRESFESGAGRMLNKYVPSDPIRPEEIDLILAETLKLLNPVWEAVNLYKPVTFIGSAGSFISLAAMAGLIASEDEDKIKRTPNLNLTTDVFKRLFDVIMESTLSDRLSMKGLAGYRAEMMVMAMLLIKSVLVKTDFKEIYISSNALKEGILQTTLYG